jgi:citrate lyase subunit beta/citryl-CoA lyase
LAARGAGIDAIDTPHMDIRDAAGLAEAARQAYDLGFTGKSAIHPHQVAAINAAFSATAEQIAWAKRVLALLPEGGGQTLGAAVLDGQLIEAPHVARARSILAAASTQP